MVTIASAVMVYGYLRQQIGRLGSMGGAVAFVTMLLVMEFGRSAETEAVFTIFVAASSDIYGMQTSAGNAFETGICTLAKCRYGQPE